jgi:hypothetical protein
MPASPEPLAPTTGQPTVPPSVPASDVSTADLEAEICTLAGHLAAATCRFLLLLGEWDRREGWAGPGIRSLAHWLSWRCGLAPVTAREQVRVARALSQLPTLKETFATGRLSYSKVRAITRVADPATEAALVELALAGTAAHVERVVRGTAQARSLDQEHMRHARRHLSPRWDDDGTLVASLRLSPDEGASVLAALHRVQAELGRGADGRPTELRPSLADALVALAEHKLAEGVPSAPGGGTDTGGEACGPEVLVQVDEHVLADAEGEPAECRVADGPALHPETARRLTCDSPTTRRTRGPDGSTFDLGRRRRRPGARLMRALWLRDGGCRFPGCGRRVWIHAHHVRHWSQGGPTDLDNLLLLCGTHHRLLHEGGYTIAVPGENSFEFLRPDASRVDEAPPLAGNPWALVRSHTAAIDADTTTPSWRGEALHLGDAVAAVLGAA